MEEWVFNNHHFTTPIFQYSIFPLFLLHSCLSLFSLRSLRASVAKTFGRKDLKRILLGNEAIARGLLENGCSFAASYPGTPASEILSSFLQMARAAESPAMGEWSINEKVAFETALAVSYAGGRSAVSMKQVGLNVACDPLMSSAYTGVKGGFLVISADDPGPHSSQTEQDSRMMAMMAKIPVLDPSTPQEAKEMIHSAYEISEEFELPVMVRPTTRVCHSRQGVLLGEIPLPSSAYRIFQRPPALGGDPEIPLYPAPEVEPEDRSHRGKIREKILLKNSGRRDGPAVHHLFRCCPRPYL